MGIKYLGVIWLIAQLVATSILLMAGGWVTRIRRGARRSLYGQGLAAAGDDWCAAGRSLPAREQLVLWAGMPRER